MTHMRAMIGIITAISIATVISVCSVMMISDYERNHPGTEESKGFVNGNTLHSEIGEISTTAATYRIPITVPNHTLCS